MVNDFGYKIFFNFVEKSFTDFCFLILKGELELKAALKSLFTEFRVFTQQKERLKIKKNVPGLGKII